MQCKKCGFLVPANMKAAIMKNFCPQCGKKLLSDHDLNHISLIQSKVSIQPFAQECTETEMFDIALFFYREFTIGYGRILIDEEFKRLSKAKTVVSEGAEFTEGEIDMEAVLENDKKSIIEEEVARVSLSMQSDAEDDEDENEPRSNYRDTSNLDDDLSESAISFLQKEDLRSKADRLRRVYQQSTTIKGKNPVVRRMSD